MWCTRWFKRSFVDKMHAMTFIKQPTCSIFFTHLRKTILRWQQPVRCESMTINVQNAVINHQLVCPTTRNPGSVKQIMLTQIITTLMCLKIDYYHPHDGFISLKCWRPAGGIILLSPVDISHYKKHLYIAAYDRSYHAYDLLGNQ